MTITNAYPAIDNSAHHDHRTLPVSSGLHQGRCSISDSTLSIPLSMLNEDGSRIIDCLPGNDCFYVCKSGFLSSGLDSRVDYKPLGVSGGRVSCDSQGVPDVTPQVALCLPSSQNIYVVSLLEDPSSFCQKVSYGGTAFFALNNVQPKLLSSIAISYSSFGPTLYYFNPPGTISEHGCPTGFSTTGMGASSPYVLEVTKDAHGDVFIRLGWNPYYVTNDYLNSRSPHWGMKVLCQGADCSQPCYIDPTRHAVNQCENCEQGYSGSSFCTVKVPENMEAAIFLFSSDNGQHTDSFAGFSSFQSSGKSVTETTQSSSFRASLNSREFSDSGKEKSERSYADRLKQKDRGSMREERALLEDSLSSQTESEQRGDQHKNFHQEEGAHHESYFKGFSDSAKDKDAVDLLNQEVSKTNKDLEDFRGFLHGSDFSSTKESTKDAGTLDKASDSITIGDDASKLDRCISLISTITESAHKLCLLLKSENPASSSLQKPSNSQISVASSDLGSPKQESSATTIFKTNTRWILILMGIITLLSFP